MSLANFFFSLKFLHKRKEAVENARRTKRMRVDYLMTYQLAGQEHQATNLVDLSSSGMRFLSNAFICEREVLGVSVCVPPLDLTLNAVARVLRTEQVLPAPEAFYTVSVRFDHMEDEEREVLETFIERLSREHRAHSFVDHEARVTRDEKEKELVS